jgi:hypothetical protein
MTSDALYAALREVAPDLPEQALDATIRLRAGQPALITVHVSVPDDLGGLDFTAHHYTLTERE